MVKVLLVEDDAIIAKIIQYYLHQEESYEVTWAQNAGEAMAKARESFDVVLLDIRLPDVNGIDLCAKLKEWHSCPILFISCLDDTDTIVKALESGGDDFITKPFDNRILAAKIQANLRRVHTPVPTDAKNVLTCRGFSLDAGSRVLRRGENEFRLSQTEYRLLLFFMQHPGRYFTAPELYKKIWKRDSLGDARTVAVHIHNLRRQIEPDETNPHYLKSVWGKGYFFDPDGNEGGSSPF